MTIEEELAAANARNAELQGQLSASQTELRAANDLLGEAQGQVSTLTERATGAEASVGRLTADLGTANAALGTATANLSTVTRERDGFSTALNAQDAYNRPLFALTSENGVCTSVGLTVAGKNRFITDTIAASGHSALPIGGAVDSPAGATAADKPKATLREKAVSATDAQPAIAAYNQARGLIH